MTERSFDSMFLQRLAGVAWRGYTQHGRGFVVLDPPRYWARFDVPTDVLIRLGVDDLLLTERYNPQLQIVVLDLRTFTAQMLTPPKAPPLCRHVTAPFE